jgi:hypothetical protein
MTTENTKVVETVRAQYRPERITTLFVGESAPYSVAAAVRRQKKNYRPVLKIAKAKNDRPQTAYFTVFK